MDARSNYYFWSAMSSVPVIGDFYRSRDRQRYMDDYLRNAGLTYADIKYPSMTMAYGSYSGTVSFVSKNLSRLYR